jgi:hypothetical protein
MIQILARAYHQRRRLCWVQSGEGWAINGEWQRHAVEHWEPMVDSLKQWVLSEDCATTSNMVMLRREKQEIYFCGYSTKKERRTFRHSSLEWGEAWMRERVYSSRHPCAMGRLATWKYPQSSIQTVQLRCSLRIMHAFLVQPFVWTTKHTGAVSCGFGYPL